MLVPILTTKLYSPPPHPHLVPRPRLIERLNEGLKPRPGATLISAPAGFGKTTLVSHWLTETQSPKSAWLSLDEGDNEPQRFLSYMIAACQMRYAGLGQTTLSLLQRCLDLAEPEGYIRLFVDEGQPMAGLLSALQKRQLSSGQAYLDTLLAVFPLERQIQNPKSEPQKLIEPLSQREQEVLRLVAEGLSTREIAETLVVTVGTAKSHLNHIYRKLDAHSRTQAIVRARALGLL